MTMETKNIASIHTELIAYFYEEGRTSFKLAEDTYDNWTVLLCERGQFKYGISDEFGEVKVGEFILCPPRHTLYREVLTTLSFHFAVFKLSVRNHEDKEIVYPFRGKLACRNSIRLMYTLEHMRQAKDNISTAYIEHLLDDILYQILDEEATLRKEKKPEDPDIAEAIRYLNEYAYTGMTLQEVAHHIRLSPSQFTRKFQKVMALSPSKYLTRLRLQKVCSLLIETNLTLEEIAEKTGYQNAFYLSRVFSKEMATNPSRYRKLHQV